MSTSTQRPVVRARYASVLLASDASPAMEATIALASAIADRDASAVHVITAVEPLPTVTPEGNLPFTPEVEERRRRGLESAVREQLRAFAPGSERWSVHQVDGHPDTTIVDAAHACRADLIVLGLGEHGIMDRWFGGETALRVLRIADVPVLAVAPPPAALPTRVVAAVDFSATSERALAAALPLLGTNARLRLVHVVPRDISLGVWPAWDDAYEAAVKASFAELRARLSLPASMCADEAVLCGDPARELLQYAERSQADLIVTGTHGHSAIAHALLGRVSTKLIRGAPCSVFAVPPVVRAS